MKRWSDRESDVWENLPPPLMLSSAAWPHEWRPIVYVGSSVLHVALRPLPEVTQRWRKAASFSAQTQRAERSVRDPCCRASAASEELPTPGPWSVENTHPEERCSVPGHLCRFFLKHFVDCLKKEEAAALFGTGRRRKYRNLMEGRKKKDQ